MAVELTIEEFVLDRLEEAVEIVHRLQGVLPDANLSRLQAMMVGIQAAVRISKDWPILISKPQELEIDGDEFDMSSMVLRVTQQLEWVTREEYIRRFGAENSPVHPVLQDVAFHFRNHKDYNEAWSPKLVE